MLLKALIFLLAIIFLLSMLAVYINESGRYDYFEFRTGVDLTSNLWSLIWYGLVPCILPLGLLLCLTFDKSTAAFQQLSTITLFPEYNLTLTFGLDGFSVIFLLLTLFIFPICLFVAQPIAPRLVVFLLGMELLLVLTFSTLDLFWFYLFFESLLIPMFLLIGLWGARDRKIKAAYYFFLYTLFGSFFMLFGIFYIYYLLGSTNFFVLLYTPLESDQQSLLWLCFFLAFAVKMPLFPLHIWLPEAHVEAPTVGSVLLAALLLKLGGYGFLRFTLPMFPAGTLQYGALGAVCALLGVIYASLSTLRQIDLKRIIAYSSVAHMSLVMVGLFAYNVQGIEGAIYLMVGHGVVSAALFLCVGVLYDRYHSRLLRYYGGLATVMPIFATVFFAFTLANMSFPGTSNFLGEFLIFLGLFASNPTTLLFATAGIVLSAVYSVWLYNRVSFGTLKTKYIQKYVELGEDELALFAPLLLAMVLLGVSADFVLEYLHFPAQTIVLSTYLMMIRPTPGTRAAEKQCVVHRSTLHRSAEPR